MPAWSGGSGQNAREDHRHVGGGPPSQSSESVRDRRRGGGGGLVEIRMRLPPPALTPRVGVLGQYSVQWSAMVRAEREGAVGGWYKPRSATLPLPSWGIWGGGGRWGRILRGFPSFLHLNFLFTRIYFLFPPSFRPHNPPIIPPGAACYFSVGRLWPFLFLDPVLTRVDPVNPPHKDPSLTHFFLGP